MINKDAVLPHGTTTKIEKREELPLNDSRKWRWLDWAEGEDMANFFNFHYEHKIIINKHTDYYANYFPSSSVLHSTKGSGRLIATWIDRPPPPRRRARTDNIVNKAKWRNVVRPEERQRLQKDNFATPNTTNKEPGNFINCKTRILDCISLKMVLGIGEWVRRREPQR